MSRTSYREKHMHSLYKAFIQKKMPTLHKNENVYP